MPLISPGTRAGKKKKRPLAQTAKLRIEGLATEAQCLELRYENPTMSLREIGHRLNISHEAVRLAILRGMARIFDPDIAKSVKLFVLEKYKLLIEEKFPAAVGGDERAYGQVRELLRDMSEVAGLLTEQPQSAGGTAIQFNYYTPTPEGDERKFVDATDYQLPRFELGDGRNGRNGHNGTNGHTENNHE